MIRWASYAPAVEARGSWWDHSLLEEWFGHEPPTARPVVIVPGVSLWEHDAQERLLADLDHLGPCALIVSKDESPKPYLARLTAPERAVFVHYARPGHLQLPGVTALPIGAPAPTAAALAEASPLRPRLSWSFAGQVNTDRRREMVESFTQVPNGEILTTSGFAAGDPHADHITRLATTRLAPAPAGPVSVDTFRCWEALEASALPLVERWTQIEDQGAVAEALVGDLGVPLVDEWASTAADYGTRPPGGIERAGALASIRWAVRRSWLRDEILGHHPRCIRVDVRDIGTRSLPDAVGITGTADAATALLRRAARWLHTEGRGRSLTLEEG